MGREDFSELQDSQINNRRICSNHFTRSDFINESKNKLNWNAVPIPHYESDTQNVVLSEEEPVREVGLTNTPPASTSTVKPLDENAHILERPNNLSVVIIHDRNTNDTLHTFPSSALKTPPLSTPSKSNMRHPTTNESNVKVALFTKGKCTASTQEESFDRFFSCKPLPDTSNVEYTTPRKRKLFKQIARQKTKIKKQSKLLTLKRSKISFLKKKKQVLTKNELVQGLAEYLTGDVLAFTKAQLLHSNNSACSEDEKYFALSMYYKSPSVYSFLKTRGFKLPCVSKIRTWVNSCNVKSGFSDEVFEKLSKRGQTMNEHEKHCVLLFDEMTIKKGVQYDMKNDLIEGFEDLGPLGRSDAIATHSLLFMLRGLKYHWKLPLAYTISENSTKNSALSVLIDMCLENIFKSGLNVRGITCDLGSSNAASNKSFGSTPDKPYFYFNNHKIYTFYDVPHLIKSIRNTLCNSDLEVDGGIVRWKDIVDFYNMDKNQPNDCRSAPKLTERHINPTEFQRMKVKLATQVFSSSVSRAMHAAVELGQLPSQTAKNTAQFLSHMNDITDALNSHSINDKCPLRRPLVKGNQVEKCLKNAIQYITTWKVHKFKKTKKGKVIRVRNPPCFQGLQSTITAVLSLSKDLHQEKNQYLLTSRLNQDPVENMFGVIRNRSGYNSNPTAFQFRRNLQHAISVRLMNPPETSNCQPDNDETLNLETQKPTSTDPSYQISEKCLNNGDFNTLQQDAVEANTSTTWNTISAYQPHEEPTLYFSYQDLEHRNSTCSMYDINRAHPLGQQDTASTMTSNLVETNQQTHEHVILEGDLQRPLSCSNPPKPGSTSATSKTDATVHFDFVENQVTTGSESITQITWEDTVVCYIAGWAARKSIEKFSCSQCSSCLTVEGNSLNTPEHTLITFKEFTKFCPDGGNVQCLKRPSPIMFQVMKRMVVSFTHHFNELKSTVQLHRTLCSIIRKDVEEIFPDWFEGTPCKEHRSYILSKFVLTKIFYTTKWISQDLRDSALLRNKRKLAEDHVVKPNAKLMKLKSL